MTPTRSLHLATGLNLPLETVTQTIAILAKRRAGKSYAMRRLAEQLFNAGQQLVLVDPKGDQWGIRSAADGKGPGLPIVILGGERADAPLEAGSGEVVAKLVVEERVSVLLDLSLFRKHEVATFMTAFLENLYRLKAREQYRTPVMLVIDEADAVAPQKPQKGEERMLGAAEDIVRRGGQRGIGCVLVTQRSAVLNKNVLTQAQVLVALRTIAPQDLAAMNAWIDVHGTEEQKRTLMESLPSLPVGDAWFWSPGWPTTNGIFKRVHVLPIETFDSGATPKPGEKPVEPKNLADVDIDALRRQMAATIEKAKADDPRELRKQIAEQKKQLEILQRGGNSTGQSKSDRPILTDADRVLLEKLAIALTERAAGAKQTISVADAKLAQQVQDAAADYLNVVRKVGMDAALNVEQTLERAGLKHILDKLGTVTSTHIPRHLAGTRAEPSGRSSAATRPAEARAPRVPDRPGVAGEIDRTQQAILDVVAMLGVRGIDINRESVARWLDIHPNGGRYGSNLAFLRAEGYLEGFDLTEKGRAAARELPTGLAAAKAPLDGTQQQILDILDLNDGKRFSRETLATVLGIHPNGGRYGSNLARLRTMGLIPDRGDIYLTEGAKR